MLSTRAHQAWPTPVLTSAPSASVARGEGRPADTMEAGAATEQLREAEAAAMEELSDEQMKEAEQEVIRRQIETTEAQLETLEGLEGLGGEEGDMLDEATMQALKVTRGE